MNLRNVKLTTVSIWTSLALLAAFPLSSQAIDVALTIDDLPAHGDITPDMSRLDLVRLFITTLKKHNVPEVYGFTIGKEVDTYVKNQTVMKEWMKAGYPIGNHTYSHNEYNKMTSADYIADIKKDETVLNTYAPNGPWRWFRFPYMEEGDTQEKRDAVRTYLTTNKYQIANVTVDFGDWNWNDPYNRCFLKADSAAIKTLQDTYISSAKARLDAAQKTSKLMFSHDVKQVMLVHLGVFDGIMLDTLLTEYEKMGVKWVGLTAASADPAYALNPDVATTDGLTFLERMRNYRDITGFAPPALPLAQVAALCK